MTRFTIRDATTLAAVAVHDDLSDAVDALETERLAGQLNPPSGRDVQGPESLGSVAPGLICGLGEQ